MSRGQWLAAWDHGAVMGGDGNAHTKSDLKGGALTRTRLRLPQQPRNTQRAATWNMQHHDQVDLHTACMPTSLYQIVLFCFWNE